MRQLSSFSVALLLALAPAVVHADAPAAAQVDRIAPDRVKVSWTDRNGVDVYMADRPDADANGAKLISANDRDGQHEVAVAPGARPFFLLRDRKDGFSTRVAERLLPLEQASNFRDIGGYPAGGKHVRWGMIYRSGATPLLSKADQAGMANLHLANMVDLRSEEERQLAPSKVYGVPYHAIGYSIMDLFATLKPASNSSPAAIAANGGAMYSAMPKMLAPQMRLLFGRLRAQEGPIVYNCSAGQDRTGFATAMILAALGVPRDVIVADYLLSTGYRRPEYEMPAFNPAAFPNNPVAQLFGHHRETKPQPLKAADGTPLLNFAFAEIDQRYGSVEAYLAQEAGVTAVDIAALRAAYLE